MECSVHIEQLAIKNNRSVSEQAIAHILLKPLPELLAKKRHNLQSLSQIVQLFRFS